MIWLAIGLALAFIMALLYAACMMGGMADDALEPYDASPDLYAAEYADVAAHYGRLAELDAYLNGPCPHCPTAFPDEAMLLTWDEICNLPEVQR